MPVVDRLLSGCRGVPADVIVVPPRRRITGRPAGFAVFTAQSASRGGISSFTLLCHHRFRIPGSGDVVYPGAFPVDGMDDSPTLRRCSVFVQPMASGPGLSTRSLSLTGPVGRRRRGGEGAMATLVVLVLFVALALLGPCFGVDSRARGGWTPTEPGEMIWPDRPVQPDRPAKTPSAAWVLASELEPPRFSDSVHPGPADPPAARPTVPESAVVTVSTPCGAHPLPTQPCPHQPRPRRAARGCRTRKGVDR